MYVICTLVLYECYCVQSIMETSPSGRDQSSPVQPLLLSTSLPNPAGAIPSFVWFLHNLSRNIAKYHYPWTTYIIIGLSTSKK